MRNIALAALMQRAGRFTVMGDLDAGLKTHRQFLAASEEAGAVQLQVAALRHLAGDLDYLHRHAEAAQCLDRALELSESSGERWNRSELYALRGRAALALGDVIAADEFIGQAVEFLRDYDVAAISEVHHALGVIRAAQGRLAEAESSLRLSLDVLGPTDYNWNKVEPALALAEFLADRAAANEATELVDTYERWAHDRGIVLWDRQIKEIRARIAS
jgi:tetratricopeptide (TPR) repeat protein